MEIKDAFGKQINAFDIVVHAGGHGPYMKYTILRVVGIRSDGKVICDKIKTEYDNPRNKRTYLLPHNVVVVNDLGALV